MTMRVRLVIAALSPTLLLAACCPPARGDARPRVTTEDDLIYTKAGEAELKLDLARPAEGDGPFPGVLVIHGGGWRQGDKAQMRGALTEFARRGYVAIAPQYRFCPQDTFPAQVHDVKAAVRWLKRHAKDYKLDPEHIGAIGFSAGGHLSLMLGLTGPGDDLEGDHSADAPSTRIQAVVNYFGPTDFTASDLPEPSRQLVKDFLGGTPEEKPAAAAKASPLTYVTKDDPPILTFHGTKDGLVPYTQAVKLTDALTAAGVPGRVDLLIGAEHGWRGNDLTQTMGEAFHFFDRYLKPANP
jgi:acetyl esterase/lipase